MEQDIYWESLHRLQANLKVLADKPEETPENTLNSLWFVASGVPLSVEAAVEKSRNQLNQSQQLELNRLIDLRLQGVPLAHISGRQQFMGLELLAGPEALIPRKETELLAEESKKILQATEWRGRQPLVIDLCTGAGNLAIVLALAHPQARVFAADISPDAIGLANRNIDFHAISNRVETRIGDLLEPFNSDEFIGNVDLITCNPPYISSNKVREMDLEISGHEPIFAFDGGPFGISIVNRLVQDALKFLKIGGWLAFEIGLGQGDATIKRIERKYSYSKIIPIKDNHNNIRAILLQL